MERVTVRNIVVWAYAMLLSFCASAAVAAQQPAKGISIPTRLPAHEARARVVNVLTDAGYTVADSSASVVHTKPKTVQRVLHLELFAKFLAVDEKSTRVVLTGRYAVEMMHEDPIPIEEASNGTAGEMWNELSTAGERIRRVLTSAEP